VTGDDGGNRKIRAGSDLSIEISERFAREVDAVLGAGRVRVARM
jgi:hypothetical protein